MKRTAVRARKWHVPCHKLRTCGNGIQTEVFWLQTHVSPHAPVLQGLGGRFFQERTSVCYTWWEFLGSWLPCEVQWPHLWTGDQNGCIYGAWPFLGAFLTAFQALTHYFLQPLTTCVIVVSAWRMEKLSIDRDSDRPLSLQSMLIHSSPLSLVMLQWENGM